MQLAITNCVYCSLLEVGLMSDIFDFLNFQIKIQGFMHFLQKTTCGQKLGRRGLNQPLGLKM